MGCNILSSQLALLGKALKGYHPSSELPWHDAFLPPLSPPLAWMEKLPLLGSALHQGGLSPQVV